MSDKRFETIINCLNQRQPDLTVIMEDVVKPHNLAAVARTADAVGIHQIHAITQRTSIKLTQMAAGGVKKYVAVEKHASTEAGIDYLKQRGFQVIATHLNHDAKDYRQVDYTPATAILVGTEYEGVSEQALSMADECITIPMCGVVQSLNVSVATALILFEAHHQKLAAGHYEKRKLDDATFYKLLFEWYHPRIAWYCKQKNLPYPKINEQAELLEPVAEGVVDNDANFTDWLKQTNDE